MNHYTKIFYTQWFSRKLLSFAAVMSILIMIVGITGSLLTILALLQNLKYCLRFYNQNRRRNVTIFAQLPGRMVFPGDTYSEKLKQLCWNNAEFYKKDESEYGQRLRLAFLGIVDHVNTVLPFVNNVQKVMACYDFDKDTPGNGYRSFVIVAYATFKHALQLCNYITVNRESLIFRKGFYMKEVEAVSHMIASLVSCFHHLHTLLNWSEPGELFPAPEHNPEALLESSDTINQYAFYGRCLAIQFCSSVQPLLKFISTFMASFSEVYYNMSFSAKAQSLFSGGKFLIDPELRARRIVNISQYASIDFCKSFWFLAESELMKKIPDFVCNAVAVNSEIEIPPEPLQILNSVGEPVNIPIPSSHIPVRAIPVRLLSSNRHEGMIAASSEFNKKYPVVPPSDSLILHCHGGGFVAQSSKSHEVYLRDWASGLAVPIISVDYSLAPEAPFPRALEEVFYAYCWAIKNCHILGSTGKKIILAGDSAGANLLLGVAIKSIEFDIRKPNGLFLAYVPVIVSSTPSPSRLLCLMDPLLPIGFLLRCLKAYACPENLPSVPPDRNKAFGTKKLTSQSSFRQSETYDGASKLALKRNRTGGPSQVPDECSSNSSTPAHPEFLQEKTGQECEPSHRLQEYYKGTERLPPVPESKDEDGNAIDEKNLKNTFVGLKRKLSNLITNTFKMVSKKDIDKTLTGTDMENLVNPFKEFKFSVPRDPYLSPYWADDSVLRQLPPTCICSVEFDPCLDDCVMFAKKLKRLGNVVCLDILEGLPHGFLNFSKVNKDAEEGSKLCMERIKALLDCQNAFPGPSTGVGNENGWPDKSPGDGNSYEQNIKL